MNNTNLAKELYAISNISSFTKNVGRFLALITTAVFVLATFASQFPSFWQRADIDVTKHLGVLVVVCALAVIFFWINLLVDLRFARSSYDNRIERHLHQLGVVQSLINAQLKASAVIYPHFSDQFEKIWPEIYQWTKNQHGISTLGLYDDEFVAPERALEGWGNFRLLAAVATRYIWLAVMPLVFGAYSLVTLLAITNNAISVF